jgi:hypothetical protein
MNGVRLDASPHRMAAVVSMRASGAIMGSGLVGMALIGSHGALLTRNARRLPLA